MTSNAELALKLIKAWRFFFDQGLIDGFGHISVRTADPDRIMISRHNLGRDAKTDDFVVVDFDGNQIGTSAPLPGELPIHLEVMRGRPDVGSVAHLHNTYATSFTMSEPELRPTYFPAAIFRDGIPTHPDSRLINNRERAMPLVETLGSRRAALLKAHGVVVTGRDVEEMVACVFILEDNARRTWIAGSMGRIEYLSDEAMAEIECEILQNRGPFRRIWALCESHYDTTLRGTQRSG